MVKTKDTSRAADARQALLDVGLDLLGTQSFAATGINTVLDEAKVPRGSFYYHFTSKDDFGLQVLAQYQQLQLGLLGRVLGDENQPPASRFQQLFEELRSYYQSVGFSRGCMVGSLSLELADQHEEFREALGRCLDEQTAVVEECLHEAGTETIGLGHLTPTQAARALMNAIEGALLRMRVEKTDAALQLLGQTFRPH
jgi:TetR/AcrR family transcriptional regulator, transcriptional repressor for nem operon